MTIVAFRKNSRTVDVKFSDGSRRNRVRLERFHQGLVLSPRHFIGKKRKNCKGEEITLVRFYNWNSVGIRFPDGSVRTKVNYLNFLTGRVLCRNDSFSSEGVLGEIRPNSTGDWMRIVAYRSLWDLDVQFRNGSIHRGIDYYRFESGFVFKKHKATKSDRVGETSIARNGEVITIIEYHRCTNVDVRFPDGTVRKGVTYHNFLIGAVCKIKRKRRKHTNHLLPVSQV